MTEGFAGNTADYSDPRNSLLDDVIDNKWLTAFDENTLAGQAYGHERLDQLRGLPLSGERSGEEAADATAKTCCRP